MNKNPIWKSLVAGTIGGAIGVAVECGVRRFLDSRHDNDVNKLYDGENDNDEEDDDDPIPDLPEI